MKRGQLGADDGLGPDDDADEANTTPRLEARLADLEWRYCLVQDELRELSDVVRRDSDVVAALQTRIELLERRLLQGGGGDDGGVDGDTSYRDDWPGSF